MKLTNNNPAQRAVGAIGDSLPSAGKLGLPGRHRGHTVKAHLPNGKKVQVRWPQGKELKSALSQGGAVKAGLVASAVAGLTAASAGVSALRRQTEGRKDAS